MKRRLARVLSLVIVVLLAAPSRSSEVAGISLPDSQTVEGKALKLNGVGLRTKMMFKVYVAGLYLENPSKDPKAVVGVDEVKRIELHLVRALTGEKVAEAIREGFERNSKVQMPSLEKRLERLNAMIPDVGVGDRIILTYVPGKGTSVEAKGQAKGVIEGKDFADALFSVWLGPSPVQADLKAALLGG